MRTLFLLLLSSLFIQSSAQQASFRDIQMKADVAYLASDILAGRAAGSPFADEAAAYISMRMAQLSLKPQGDANDFTQLFPIIIAGHGQGSGAPTLKTKNVLGYLDNGASHTIMIGAHYDHLGYGGSGSGSLHVGDAAPHNGADDNASGVAVMLDLAHRLQQDSAPKAYNYLFAAFSAEELGLVGSKYLAANMPKGIAPLAAMLNFDMVGRLSKDSVIAINGTGTSPSWDEILTKAGKNKVKINAHESGLGPSDHASFYLQDVPVLHFFTGQHPQYHKPEDDIELINFPGMVIVSDLVYDIIKDLPAPGSLAFAKTKDESQNEVSSFKVTMGIMPDYVFAGTGVRVDGILSDRPAEKAGLERGDILLKIDDTDIKDIYDYMKILGEHEKGDRVELVIDRGSKKIRKKLTF